MTEQKRFEERHILWSIFAIRFKRKKKKRSGRLLNKQTTKKSGYCVCTRRTLVVITF